MSPFFCTCVGRGNSGNSGKFSGLSRYLISSTRWKSLSKLVIGRDSSTQPLGRSRSGGIVKLEMSSLGPSFELGCTCQNGSQPADPIGCIFCDLSECDTAMMPAGLLHMHLRPSATWLAAPYHQRFYRPAARQHKHCKSALPRLIKTVLMAACTHLGGNCRQIRPLSPISIRSCVTTPP